MKFKLDASLQLQARSFVQVLELDHQVDQKPEGNIQTALASLAECSEKVYARERCQCVQLELVHLKHSKIC